VLVVFLFDFFCVSNLAIAQKCLSTFELLSNLVSTDFSCGGLILV